MLFLVGVDGALFRSRRKEQSDLVRYSSAVLLSVRRNLHVKLDDVERLWEGLHDYKYSWRGFAHGPPQGSLHDAGRKWKAFKAGARPGRGRREFVRISQLANKRALRRKNNPARITCEPSCRPRHLGNCFR